MPHELGQILRRRREAVIAKGGMPAGEGYKNKREFERKTLGSIATERTAARKRGLV